jgi:CheY-like chemotaxis protein
MKKILFIEDNEYFLMTLKNYFHNHKDWPYTSFFTSNPLEARNVIQENPDLSMVVTDRHMPLEDGLSLAYELKESKSWIHLLIISSDLSTAQHLPPQTGFLAKPFSLPQLEERILDLILHERIRYPRQ